MTDGGTQPKPPGVTDIFSEYVRQRQQGKSRDEAIAYLRPILVRLHRDARQQLAALIRSWEAREGSKYQVTNQAGAFVNGQDWLAMLDSKDEDLSWLPEPDSAQSGGQPSPIYNVHAPVHPSLADEQTAPPPQQEQVLLCPSCGKPNRLGVAYCYACGALLNVVSADTRSLKPIADDLQEVGQTHFGATWTLLLQVRGAGNAIALRFTEKQEWLLGRSTPDGHKPDVDLTPYGAAEGGVSRSHAQLRYQGNTITLTDLGSVNHTYINGQRLHAHEVRVLRDGDEIRLGLLPIKVKFQQQLRRLK